MKLLLVVWGCLCFFSVSVFASSMSDSELVFNGSPFFDSDQKGGFTSCGFIVTTETVPTVADEGISLAVRVATAANNSFQVVATTAVKKINASAWTPSPKIIQWVKVGNSEPIVLDPYNLITQKEKGLSFFSTTADENMTVFSEIEKRAPAVWVKFYSNGKYFVYSGVLKISDIALAQIKQCVKTTKENRS